MRRGLVVGVAALVTAIAPGAASAGLILLKPAPGDQATFVGKGGYSADGLGQAGTGGVLEAAVPAGSTVVRAYLYGTYFRSEPTPADLAINFDGTNVTLAKIGAVAAASLTSARAEVTAQVAAKVGTGGGVKTFAVLSDPPTLNGVALVVVYSNPAKPTTTVAVLDGAAAVAGDTTTFAFEKPLDPASAGFSAAMSLGSGHSYQGEAGHVCGTNRPAEPRLPQSSTVDVNGRRLSSCAGSYDDGLAQDGGLITVGGVGDSTDNPSNPDQLPGDGTTPRTTDDELYDIKPFLTKGDTQLSIATANASKDDIVFLAVIAVTGEAGVSTGGTLPAPQVGKTFNAAVTRGVVTCRNAGSRRFQKLTKATQFHVGSECDATKGQITITSAAGKTTLDATTPTQTATFYDGRFVLRQKAEAAPVTELVLSGGSFSGCPKAKSRDATKPTKTVRKLWGRGKGRFRTRGRYSSATVRGTWWYVADRCDGTLTTVKEGTVVVDDTVNKKKVVVKKGMSYLVKGHRGRGRRVRILF